jgi:hypothetical protein
MPEGEHTLLGRSTALRLPNLGAMALLRVHLTWRRLDATPGYTPSMALVKVGQFSHGQLGNLQRALQRAGANQPCPRCQTRLFTILDQATVLTIGGGTGIPGGAPCVTTVCNNCGFVSSHLISVLLPEGLHND